MDIGWMGETTDIRLMEHLKREAMSEERSVLSLTDQYRIVYTEERKWASACRQREKLTFFLANLVVVHIRTDLFCQS